MARKRAGYGAFSLGKITIYLVFARSFSAFTFPKSWAEAWRLNSIELMLGSEFVAKAYYCED